MIRLPGPRPTKRSRVPRLEARDLEAVWPEVQALEPGALLIDIEPFVAAWGTDEPALLRGLHERIEHCATLETLREIMFVTNSARRPSGGVPSAPVPVSYISQARKPFLELSRFSSLRPPVVVIGDQVLTDGLMAWRLNATFVQVPLPARASFGVRAQALLGRLVAPLVFRRLGGTTAPPGAPVR